MADDVIVPTVRQTVLDTIDARALAEFYRRFLGLRYRAGDEPPPPGEPDPAGQDWLVLVGAPGSGAHSLAFQQVGELARSTWPEPAVPQQLHLDMTVPDADALEQGHARALDLGARVLFDRSDDPQEPLRVYADPDGHPFCVFVG
jgi:catechol 2,3-dioxygenase-like lactoylglutathione lyase family enzyme